MILLVINDYIRCLHHVKYKNGDEDGYIFLLAVTIMGATITDATFDIFQGVAAILDEEYTALSASMLVIATWLGVGEEIIEGIFEIGTMCCIEGMEKMGQGSKLARIMVDIIMHFGCIVELSMGIYIFSTFEFSFFMIIGLGVQSLYLLIAICWIFGGRL